MPMRDPHVVALIYKAKAPNGFVYHDPPTVEVETRHFRIHLENWKLRLEPRDHFASPGDIRPYAERFVRSWMIQSSLAAGFPEIEFEYDGAEVVDRVPPPPGVLELYGEVNMKITATMRAEGTVISNRDRFPEAPLTFLADADVETLWNRYQRYLAGSEPLPSMAYFCYTAVKTLSGGARHASKRYNISQPVLNKFRELSSTGGDAADARKYQPGPRRSLSQAERKWLDAATREIIRRLGQVAAGVTPSLLVMTDLPSLHQ